MVNGSKTTQKTANQAFTTNIEFTRVRMIQQGFQYDEEMCKIDLIFRAKEEKD